MQLVLTKLKHTGDECDLNSLSVTVDWFIIDQKQFIFLQNEIEAKQEVAWLS